MNPDEKKDNGEVNATPPNGDGDDRNLGASGVREWVNLKGRAVKCGISLSFITSSRQLRSHALLSRSHFAFPLWYVVVC